MIPSLNRAVELQQAVSIPDGAGGFTRSWQTLGTLWAEIKPGTGNEFAGVEVKVSAVNYLITVRGAEAGSPRRPKAGQRFRDGTRLFQILAVTEADAEARHLKCFSREEVAP